MRSRPLLALAALLFSPLLAFGQSTSAANFTYKYDVGSTNLTFCALQGRNADPFREPYAGPGRIETSGSSQTITGVDPAADVFAPVDPGDVLLIYLDNSKTEVRLVVTNADPDTVTVETAIDLTGGFTFAYRKLVCGIGDNDGWIPVHGSGTVQFGVQYDAGDLDALKATWQCKSGALGALPVRVYPGVSSDCGDGTLNADVCEFTTTGSRLSYKVANNAFAYCRLGVGYKTTDGATAEEVTAILDKGP